MFLDYELFQQTKTRFLLTMDKHETWHGQVVKALLTEKKVTNWVQGEYLDQKC